MTILMWDKPEKVMTTEEWKSMMDDRTWVGNLAEAKVVAELARQRFEVFVNTSGKSSFDLVAHREGRLIRIEVKGSSVLEESGAPVIRMSSMRGPRHNQRMKHIDPTKFDLLAIYIVSWDEVAFIRSDKIAFTSKITIRREPSKYTNGLGTNRIIANMQDAWKVLHDEGP